MIHFRRIVRGIGWAFLVTVVAIGLSVGGLVVASACLRGTSYLPKMTKEMVKNFLFRTYGPKTVAAPTLVGQYSKLYFKSLMAGSADHYRERVLCFDISFFDYADLLGFFGEIFIKEEYYFSTTKSAPYIIDAGGNIGMTTLYFKMLYPEAEILVFEPSMKCFEVLQKNILDNHLRGVTAVNKALLDRQAPCSFWDPSHGKGCGSASIVVQRNDGNMTTVAGDMLSTYVTRPVDLLKMDIEGAEHLVLEDLATSGKLKFIKEMILEYHHHMPQNTNDQLGRFLATLEKNGFGYQIRGCNWGIGYQFDPIQGQVLYIHGYQKPEK